MFARDGGRLRADRERGQTARELDLGTRERDEPTDGGARCKCDRLEVGIVERLAQRGRELRRTFDRSVGDNVVNDGAASLKGLRQPRIGRIRTCEQHARAVQWTELGHRVGDAARAGVAGHRGDGQMVRADRLGGRGSRCGPANSPAGEAFPSSSAVTPRLLVSTTQS